jgi:hypothetical protein
MIALNKTTLFSVLLAVSTLALSGCNEKTEEWYMAHHDELIKKYGECLNTQTFSSAECVPAVNAYHRSQNDPDVKAGIRKVNDEFNQKRMQGIKNE